MKLLKEWDERDRGIGNGGNRGGGGIGRGGGGGGRGGLGGDQNQKRKEEVSGYLVHLEIEINPREDTEHLDI